jgi:hypothetical protein
MLPITLMLCAAASAWDPPAHDALLPDAPETGAEIASSWAPRGGWWQSEPRAREGGGTRVGALAFAPSAERIEAEARGVDADGARGPWLPLSEHWRDEEGHRVLVAELGARWPRAELRLREPERIDSIAWELRIPVDEPRGEPAIPPPTLSAALQAIGVISRAAWGASATTCTSTEDHWYRMAIHHTAGTQTSGGTVQGAVRALQSYSMGSGGYCDIPYQFLVGYDGSLWEGRSLSYYSGATGGGNNDGNIALSFLGCYDSTYCHVGPHAATDAMMAWARLLIHTLASEHAFAVNSDTVRGHRDWPHNSTVCPGDYVVARFDELLSTGSYYQGSHLNQSFPGLHEGSLEIPLGQSIAGWIELRNDGMETWSPGQTFLAPIPRDQASPLAASDWVSEGRAATVGATTAPGATGRFSFSLNGRELGASVQYFGLVQEGVTWFADPPWGGGPPDDTMAVSVEVVDEPGVDTSPPGDSEVPREDSGAPPEDSAALADGWRPPGARLREAWPQGCGCGVPPRSATGWGWLSLLAAGALTRRRARQDRGDHAA